MSIREDISLGELKLRSLKATTELTANVTQATSRSTGVTVNAVQGVITMNSASLAQNAVATFTVTNNRVQAGSIILLCMSTAGSAGSLTTPIVNSVAAAGGSFVISVTNLAATADTAASAISFFVVNAISGM